MGQRLLSRRGSLSLGLLALFAGAARAADPLSVWQTLDAAATKLISDHGSPGVSVSVLKKGRFVYSRGFGWANLETRTPAQPTSVYKIGSITKQFTAAALLALAEEGKLSIDAPLARYFADFPRAKDITLRQMLTHTSGLGNYTDTENPETFIQEARLDYDAGALYRLMLATKPLSGPTATPPTCF
jgi:CubicO group peptidase (beta-lactamase class C family)